MEAIGPDLFETVTAAEDDERRLTTKEKVKAELGETTTTYDALIDGYIDQVSDGAAQVANLEPDSAGSFPTFGKETLRATWSENSCARGETLLIPWRPKIAVTTVVENGITLVVGTDYRVENGWALRRLCNGLSIPWLSCYAVVVTFDAGWELPDGVPPGLEARVLEQVRLMLATRDRDPTLRSENSPGIWAGSYAVAGGDTISDTGWLRSLEAAVRRYGRIAV